MGGGEQHMTPSMPRPVMPQPDSPSAERRIAVAVPKLTRLAEKLSDRHCNELGQIIEDLDP
ncbi:MAG: hypothetical protein Unbinned3138contig1000_66 [Prokaryotic dsDNA virus sp.]|nr:MAG: hypothetical protein Unbinned3138contig1000_66 [Prokaryotic dsDNA virus sp.]